VVHKERPSRDQLRSTYFYGMQHHLEQTKDCTVAVGGWSWGRKASVPILTGMLFLGLCQTSARAVASVTLVWNQNLESDIAGYRIYYGASSGTYTNSADTGGETSATVVNLHEGIIYYFAVTAYNSAGLESDFSNEYRYLVPMPLNQVEMALGTNSGFVLKVTSSTGGAYDVEASEDLKTWTVIGTVAIAAGGVSNFNDTNGPAISKRFYRTVETQP
jgi:hypothetical protein